LTTSIWRLYFIGRQAFESKYLVDFSIVDDFAFVGQIALRISCFSADWQAWTVSIFQQSTFKRSTLFYFWLQTGHNNGLASVGGFACGGIFVTFNQFRAVESGAGSNPRPTVKPKRYAQCRGTVTPTHVGTFACHTFLRDTKASKRANLPTLDNNPAFETWTNDSI
jgi:hypothetical protein